MATTKTNSFIKQFIATLKGDDNEVLAQKVWRQVDSALSSQINALSGDQIDYETKVEEAKEALTIARVNDGKLITDRSSYVSNLIYKKNLLTQAEEDLVSLQEQITFLKEEYETLKKD